MSVRKLDEHLDALGCQALVVVAKSSRDPFMAPFTGPRQLSRSLVIAPRGGPAHLGYWTPMEREEAALCGLPLLNPDELDIVRWARDAPSPAKLLADVLSRALFLCELAPGRLALAGHWGAGQIYEACGHLATEGWSFVAGENLVSFLKKAKSADDLAEMRRVAAGTMAAFRHVAELLAAAAVVRHAATEDELHLSGEPLRVVRLQREIARVLAEHGLEQPAGGICAPGREGAVPHTSGTPERVLRPHESLVVDVYPRGALFADCTRTFCVGAPPEPLARAHAHVREALAVARQNAVPGRRGWSVQEAVCDYFAGAGYPTMREDITLVRGYVHGLGHGVGYEVHEFPLFAEQAAEDESRLEAGDVFTLEPGLYEPDQGWAVRLEDLYHLDGDVLENLTPLPYDLDPRAW